MRYEYDADIWMFQTNLGFLLCTKCIFTSSFLQIYISWNSNSNGHNLVFKISRFPPNSIM